MTTEPMEEPTVFSHQPPFAAPPSAPLTIPSVAEDALLPQTLGGVFDEAFDLYKRNFISLALITALIYLPSQLILHGIFQVWLEPLWKNLNWESSSAASNDALLLMFGCFLTGIPSAGLPGLLSLPALALVSGPIVAAVTNSYLGQTIRIKEAYRAAKSHVFRLLGGWAIIVCVLAVVGFVYFLFAMSAFTMMAILFASFPSSVSANLLGITMMVLVFMAYPVGIAVVAGGFLFTSQLIIIEDIPVIHIAARSLKLIGKKLFWRTFRAAFFLPILVFGLQALVFGSVSVATELTKSAPMVQFLVGVTLSSAIGFFFQPYPMIFLTLLYYDYRVRREGLDVRLLSKNLPLPEPETPVASAPAYPGPIRPAESTPHHGASPAPTETP